MKSFLLASVMLAMIGCTNTVNPFSHTQCNLSAHTSSTYKSANNFTGVGTCIGIPAEWLVMNADNQTFAGVDCSSVVENDCVVIGSNCRLFDDPKETCIASYTIDFADDGSNAIATDNLQCANTTGFNCQETYTVNYTRQ